MTSRQPSFLFLLGIASIALVAGACAMASIKTHFYVWELLFDGKTILLAGLYMLLAKPGSWKTEARSRGVFAWSLVNSVGAFLIPALISGAVVGGGLFAKKVTFAAPENGATLLLTLLFDIPAVFIFSVTTVFVEEYVFRGYVLSEYMKSGRAVAGLAVSTVLWAAYAIVEVLPLEEYSWISAGLLVFYYMAVGIGAAALYRASRSLWVSYAFRIGVLTITPSVLSGVTGVTDAFFTTENLFFFGDGVITSAVIVILFVIVYVAAGKRKKTANSSHV